MRELRYKEQNNERRRSEKEETTRLMPHNASLIAPNKSAPAYISGAETRKLAAKDRLEVRQTKF